MANQHFKMRSWATFRVSFYLPLTRARSFHWRSLALPLDLVIRAILANIQLVLCRMCPVASIFQLRKLISPRHGVWVPNALTVTDAGLDSSRLELGVFRPDRGVVGPTFITFLRALPYKGLSIMPYRFLQRFFFTFVSNCN